MVAIKHQQQLIRDGETALLKYILYCQAMCSCGGCYIFWQIWGGGKLSSYTLNRKIQKTG